MPSKTFTQGMQDAIANYYECRRKRVGWGEQMKMGCLERIERHLEECGIGLASIL